MLTPKKSAYCPICKIHSSQERGSKRGTRYCGICGNTFTLQESREAKEEEAQYVVIDGERRQVVPCPDGRPNCEVLHTTPAPMVSDRDPED